MNNFTPRAQQVLALARKEADRFNHNFVGTEHLLLGLVRQSEGVAIDVLKRLGVSPEEVRRQTRRVLQESPVQTNTPERNEPRPARDPKGGKTPLVDQLATDLTALAEQGKLDPVVGRETEIG